MLVEHCIKRLRFSVGLRLVGRRAPISLFVPFLALSSLCTLSGQSSPEQGQSPTQDYLLPWLNAIAQQELDRRAAAIDQIHTQADAENRKQMVRTKLLEDLGGLPHYSGPLNPRITDRKSTRLNSSHL